MAQKIPVSGEIYRHFKEKLYQIVTIAQHSETGEMLVIYQALYGDFGIYARPLSMFLSEVDHEKYPYVTQKYRFELVRQTSVAEEWFKTPEQEREHFDQAAKLRAETKAQKKAVLCAKADEPESRVRMNETPEAAEAQVEPKLMEFFDADHFEDKYNILVSMRDIITDKMINNMAVVLDVVIPEGELDERYEQLKQCVKTRLRYENMRLR